MCSAVFRYLHEGKLFEFEVIPFDEPFSEVPDPKHHPALSQAIGCFWLCASCALNMTLVRESRTGEVVIVPLHDDVGRGGDVTDATASNYRPNTGDMISNGILARVVHIPSSRRKENVGT